MFALGGEKTEAGDGGCRAQEPQACPGSSNRGEGKVENHCRVASPPFLKSTAHRGSWLARLARLKATRV